METLRYKISSKTFLGKTSALVGVVGSGNLEIFIKPGGSPDICEVVVKTSARGFGETWQAVLTSFAGQNAIGGTEIQINDLGATPAVVTLRLAQAFATPESTRGAK